MKLVDTLGSGSSDQYGRAGSIPVPGTKGMLEMYTFLFYRQRFQSRSPIYNVVVPTKASGGTKNYPLNADFDNFPHYSKIF